MVPTLLESIGRKLKLQRSGAHHFGLYNSVVIYTCVGTHWASSIHIKVCGKPESGHRVLRAHSLTYIQTDRETASLTHFEAFKFLRCGDRLQITYRGWSREDFMREAARLAALLAIRLLPMHDDLICMLSKSVLSCPLHLENRPSAWLICLWWPPSSRGSRWHSTCLWWPPDDSRDQGLLPAGDEVSWWVVVDSPVDIYFLHCAKFLHFQSLPCVPWSQCFATDENLSLEVSRQVLCLVCNIKISQI